LLNGIVALFLLVGVGIPAAGVLVIEPALSNAGLSGTAAFAVVAGLWLAAALVGAWTVHRGVRRALHEAASGFDERFRNVAAQLDVAGQAVVERRAMHQVVDSMPDSLIVFDANGVVDLANATSAARLGYAGPDELVGLGLDALAGESAPSWWQVLQNAGAFSTRDVRLRGYGDQVVTFAATARVFRRSEGGERAFVLVARDNGELDQLTQELAATTERLEDSERFFQDLFDAMEDPITVLSPTFEVLQANRQARMVFGRDLIGRRCYRAFRMRDAPCDDCPARSTFAAGETTNVEHRIFGNAITRITTYPLLGKDGQVKAVINHKRDVTKERQLEDLKASFLATVSHELRTPLTSIVGFNKLNLRRLQRFVRPFVAEGPEEVRTALQKALSDMEVMGSEGERLGRLVNDVLDLSKLEAGKLRLNPEAVEILSLVQGAVTATSSLCAGRHLLVLPDVPDVCPPAWGDRDRLSQVLVNLLSNAIKYTKEGEVRIGVSVLPTMLVLSVQDSGAGIPPEELPHIFERFRQAGESQKGRPGGTGLGLAICKQIVQLHGGTMSVESRVEQGSTFTFSVPRADSPARKHDSVGGVVAGSGEVS
jgi:signal transduction histidine kinase